MLIILLGTHLFLTFYTGFVQKHIFTGIKLSFKTDNDKKGNVSIFGSFMTALSSTVGTGNIIGTATGIVSGGPGAIFWMWIGGFLGIATKYAESFIAVKYRTIDKEGKYCGGAMTVLEHFNYKKFAKIFAIFCALGAFGIGCATQANSIAGILNSNFDINQALVGAILCVLTFIVIFGGIKSIAKVCEKLVPIMSIVYIVGCVAILIINRQYLLSTISLILSSAFTVKAMTGGFIGSTVMLALRYGIARGLFSNEAGMGSAPIASAAGQADNAAKPAIVGSTGVFWDTIIVCFLTGLVLVSCIIANDAITSVGVGASELVSACFSTIPVFGMPLLVFGILTFAYSTILGWSYYGETCISYLFGKKAIRYYQIAWIIVIFIGSVSNLVTVWAIADILNALMCIPNIFAIYLALKVLKKETKHYLDNNHLDEEDNELV